MQQNNIMFLIFPVVFLSLVSNAYSFSRTCPPIHKYQDRLQHRRLAPGTSVVTLFAEAGENTAVAGAEREGDAVNALGPASLPAGSNQDDKDTPMNEGDEASTQVFMITREMKRTMMEELGYRRKEVDSIRLELVANIIQNRVQCPSEGMPTSWVDEDRGAMMKGVQDTPDMMQRMENESKYPLKFPLLAVSLVLFGKGFSDALITLIKVNIDFPGASLTAQFQGIPVLAIDLVCVITGATLGLWTWKTMK